MTHIQKGSMLIVLMTMGSSLLADKYYPCPKATDIKCHKKEIGEYQNIKVYDVNCETSDGWKQGFMGSMAAEVNPPIKFTFKKPTETTMETLRSYDCTYTFDYNNEKISLNMHRPELTRTELQCYVSEYEPNGWTCIGEK